MDAQTNEAILRAGIAAPSADNSQPWRFTWRGDDLDLRIDPERSGGVSDARFVLSDLAAGACIESMLVKGRALGWAVELEMFPRPEDERLVARIHWRRDPGVAPDPLAAALESRHTDRSFPWHGTVDPAARARLDAAAQAIGAARLWWPGTPRARTSALRVIRQAESLRFSSPALHAELFSSIRFAAGWRSACEEGLAPATLGVEPPMRPLFQAMRSPALTAMLNRLSAASMLGWRSAWLPIRLSPGLCLVVVPSTTRADVVAGGRALLRTWLAATLEGLSVQPYAAAGVLGLGFVPVEARFRPVIARLGPALSDLCTPGHGLVFLRLGHARSQPQTRSGRRALGSFGDFGAGDA